MHGTEPFLGSPFLTSDFGAAIVVFSFAHVKSVPLRNATGDHTSGCPWPSSAKETTFNGRWHGSRSSNC